MTDSQKFFGDLRDFLGYLGFQSTSLKVLDWKARHPFRAHLAIAVLGIVFGTLTGLIIGITSDLTPNPPLSDDNYLAVGVLVGLIFAGLVLRLAPRLERKVTLRTGFWLALIAAALFISSLEPSLGDYYPAFATLVAGVLIALVLGKMNFLGGFLGGTAMFFGELGAALGWNVTSGVATGAEAGILFGAFLGVFSGANAYFRLAVYSPKSDTLRLERMKTKLQDSGGDVTGVLINMNMAAMRLYSYEFKRDISRAGELARSLSTEFKSVLTLADAGTRKLSERDMVHLQVMSSYWESQAAAAAAKKSMLEQIELEAKVRSYLGTAKNEEALQVLQGSLKAKQEAGDESGAMQTLREIADARRKAGDPEGALESLQAATARYPRLWFDVGFLLGQMKRYQESIAAYEKFLEVAPGSAMALNNIGFAFESLGDYSRALDLYTQALEADKSLTNSRAGRSLALFKLGRVKEAVESYEQGLELEPKNINYLLALNSLYHDQLHDYERAAKYSALAADADPKNPAVVANLAESMLSVGRYEEARLQAGAALQFDLEPSWRLAMLFTVACSNFLEGKTGAETGSLEEFARYRNSLPGTFVNDWGYEGDIDLITRSSLATESKRKLFEALRTIGVSVPTLVSQ